MRLDQGALLNVNDPIEAPRESHRFAVSLFSSAMRLRDRVPRAISQALRQHKSKCVRSRAEQGVLSSATATKPADDPPHAEGAVSPAIVFVRAIAEPRAAPTPSNGADP